MPEWLYGLHPVEEALRAGRRRVEEVLGARSDLEQVSTLCRERHVPLRRAAPQEVASRSGTRDHQGVAARVGPYPYVSLVEVLDRWKAEGGPALFVVLDHLQDPHNLGSILRSSAGVGAHGVILTADRAVGVTPAVVKASAGMAEHMRVVRVGGIAEGLRALNEEGIQLVGASADGERLWTEMPALESLAIVLGGESSGMRPGLRKICPTVARIPLAPPTESLNVSVAAAVLLFEVARRRAAGA